jgi:hypothetical protein
MTAAGAKVCTIPGGRIPLHNTGSEPEFTSFERVCILNTDHVLANVKVFVYFEDRDPVGPYRITVAANRTRHVRINDLIFPEAVPLETNYALLVCSDIPVVVQFSRQDTRERANAQLGTIAFRRI